jgi:hypothetical protein
MKSKTFLKTRTCEIGGSHSSVDADIGIMGSEAASLGENLSTFEKIVMPSSSESDTRRKISGLVFPEDDDATTHRNLGNYFPNDKASRRRKFVILKQSSFKNTVIYH